MHINTVATALLVGAAIVVPGSSFSTTLQHHDLQRSCSVMATSSAASSAATSQATTDFTPVDPLMIRNVALVGHSHSGKSALAEWMLYDEDILTKKPVAGESVLDFEAGEAARHSSVFSRECTYMFPRCIHSFVGAHYHKYVSSTQTSSVLCMQAISSRSWILHGVSAVATNENTLV